jgi:hypothetical protein
MKKFNNQSYVSHVDRMNYGGQSSIDLPCSH